MVATPAMVVVTAAVVAAAVSIPVSLAVTHWAAKAPEVRLIQGRSQRENPRAWPPLEQSQVDAISAAVRRLAPRRVVIYCGSQACEDLALDIENALETAHWPADKVAPVMDELPTGITCSDPELTAALVSAGLPVSSMDGDHASTAVAVIIGRRP